ncbi:hypothetical protein L1887_62259 [Cichorium endivia]|nr:hypothetical protein L1887_62259 [Cichorium endivia]
MIVGLLIKLDDWKDERSLKDENLRRQTIFNKLEMQTYDLRILVAPDECDRTGLLGRRNGSFDLSGSSVCGYIVADDLSLNRPERSLNLTAQLTLTRERSEFTAVSRLSVSCQLNGHLPTRVWLVTSGYQTEPNSISQIRPTTACIRDWFRARLSTGRERVADFPIRLRSLRSSDRTAVSTHPQELSYSIEFKLFGAKFPNTNKRNGNAFEFQLYSSALVCENRSRAEHTVGRRTVYNAQCTHTATHSSQGNFVCDRTQNGALAVRETAAASNINTHGSIAYKF